MMTRFEFFSLALGGTLAGLLAKNKPYPKWIKDDPKAKRVSWLFHQGLNFDPKKLPNGTRWKHIDELGVEADAFYPSANSEPTVFTWKDYRDNSWRSFSYGQKGI